MEKDYPFIDPKSPPRKEVALSSPCESARETGSGVFGEPPRVAKTDKEDFADPPIALVEQVTTGSSCNVLTPPPNGGWLAWAQVAGSFCLYFNTLGLLNIFGLFQAYYEKNQLRESSPSAISWIGSVQAFCLMAVGVVVGPLYDAGYFRSLLASGTFLVTFGFMMTSVSSSYWQILLAQGFCIGLGTSCLTIPSIALVPTYFTTRRARAMAIATVGSSLGATLYPLIFQNLTPRIGFPWTVRVLGFISFALCCFSMAVMRRRDSSKSSGHVPPPLSASSSTLRSFIQRSALGERTYMVYCVAIFFSNVAFFEPLFYLEGYALEHGMRGQLLAGYLLAILNAASIPGRIVPSFAADRLGPLNTFVLIAFGSGTSVFCWTTAYGAGGNTTFAAFYGFFSGGVVSLAPVVLASITTDLSRLGTRLGAVSILKGIGSLCGPPIAGAILDVSGSYLGVQLFCGFSLMLTVLFSVVLRFMIAGSKKIREDL